MTAWIVTDGALWKKLTEVRRGEIKLWLRMNEIDPNSVPVDSTVMIVPEGSAWEIWYEEFVRENGNIVIDPKDPDSAYVQQRSVPLIVDPPMHWLIPARELSAA